MDTWAFIILCLVVSFNGIYIAYLDHKLDKCQKEIERIARHPSS